MEPKRLTNNLMKTLLQKTWSVLKEKDLMNLIHKNPELYRSFHPVFIEQNGMVFLADQKNLPPSLEEHGIFQDAVGIECFYNKKHIDELISTEISLDEQVRVWDLLSKTWVWALKKAFPLDRFIIIFWVTFWDYPAVDLRFYKKRDGSTWIDYSSPEKLEKVDGAICIDFA